MDIKNNVSALKRSGKLKFILIILAAGIALLLVGSKTNAKNTEKRSENASISISEYESLLESKIKNICEEVDGVSDVTVALSLEAARSDSSDTAQKISGIGIVCRGGGDPRIQKELLSLISAACDVGTNKIFITEAQK